MCIYVCLFVCEYVCNSMSVCEITHVQIFVSKALRVHSSVKFKPVSMIMIMNVFVPYSPTLQRNSGDRCTHFWGPNQLNEIIVLIST